MATEELIPVGETEAYSDEFTLGPNESVTLTIVSNEKNAPSRAVAALEKQTSGGVWMNVHSWGSSTPSMVLTAMGTFRLHRIAGTTTFGIDADW